MPWGTPYSDPETWTILLANDDFGSGAALTFYSVFSQFYQLVIDGRNSGAPIFVKAGAVKTMKGSYIGQAPHTVSVVGCGQSAAANLFDPTPTQIWFLSNRASTIHCELNGVPEQFSEGDGGQFSNWNVTGVKRFLNCRPVAQRTTWGEIDLTLTTVGTKHTLTLSIGGNTLASGSVVGNGIITLAEANNSGISALGEDTVTLNYTGDIPNALGSLLTAFPAQYNIYYRLGSPVTVFGTPQAKKVDDGRVSATSFTSGPLAAGTWYVVVRQVNEDGIESTNTANFTVQIVTTLGAPGIPVYASGGASATVIHFTASAAITSTYNLYDSDVLSVISTNPVSNSIAGTGTISLTLPALTNLMFTGTRYVFVRALLAGIESGNSIALAIPYVAGVVQGLAPNPPAVNYISTNGKSLSVAFSLDMLNQPITPTKVQLFLSITPTFDFTSESAHVAISANGRFAMGTVTGVAGANGLYYFAIRATTAGGVQSQNVNYGGPIRLTTVAPPQPAYTVRLGV
jgi:hypothetical protein